MDSHPMFSGLSAFPLTPLREGHIDEAAFIRLIERLVTAQVDSICVLGSTGNYAYLNVDERQHIARLAGQHAGGLPLIIGVSALRTCDVLVLTEGAQQANAAAVLLAPMSYQPLTDEEVFKLYETVTATLSVPLVVYDNPRTTNFEFSPELHSRIAQLSNISSIKIPAVPLDTSAAREQVQRLRALLPPHVSLGISGDAAATTGLLAGCDTWYSVIGGLFPETALAITRAAQNGDAQTATTLSERLEPIWALFRRHGSLRVIATAAELQGHAASPCLPPPLQALGGEDRQRLTRILETML